MPAAQASASPSFMIMSIQAAGTTWRPLYDPPSMRFVPMKSEDQQAMLTVRRTRDLLVRQRTQLINAMRAHLAEFGLVAARGRDGRRA